MASTQKHQVLYSASTPIQGAAASTTSYVSSPESRGLVPYFVSGPLSRKGYIGFAGALLHVAAWLCAVIFDIVLFTHLNTVKAPGAYTFWLWGFITLTIGLAVLLGATVWHMLPGDDNKFPEGGAPPFMMTLFIGGAQISLTLTILQMIATLFNYTENNDFLWINATEENDADARHDQLSVLRNLLVWSMISKTYIVHFLKNNQEWAGPANELKKQSAPVGPRPFGA